MQELEQLYRRYYQDVYLYLKALTGDAAVAEELTAETFLRACAHAERFRGDCDIRTWLCQIAKNLYFSHHRRQKRLVPLPEAFDPPDPCANIEQDYENKESLQRVQRHLEGMKETYRQVFTLRVFSELSYVQIAALFGRTEGWARVTFLRAKRKLQQQMAKEEQT
ncbi:MAG: RNA polymerase sigma factor [Clostridiales bacterium]|nr:RNA polymerase sigma factor [Clostridiales bacterium]